MHVRVKLLGTLPSYYRHDYPAAGLDLELPAGATIRDLVAATGIPEDRVAIVTINNLLAKADAPVPEHAVVKLMQPLAGG